MSDKTLAILQRALAERRVLRYSNRFEQGHTSGYVLDVGPRLVLFAVFDDAARLNGYEVCLWEDLRALTPEPTAAFLEEALNLRGERPSAPGVGIGDIASAIRDAAARFPLVTLHQQRIDPDICWIGRVEAVERASVTLLEITPDASWEEEISRYRLDTITRLDFGGAYEAALALVGDAGAPKPVLH